MTLIDLAKLVADMRQFQKQYFRTRTPSALDESKRMEKAVDKACADILCENPQMELFEP